MNSWHSYPSPFSLGHRALSELFDGDVVVEEKIDGSQFSFGSYDGVLKIRSKGQEIFVDNPEKMFVKAVDYVKSIQGLLMDGWMYTGEYLSKPKHNTIAYERIPKNFIMLYDVRVAEESYLNPGDKIEVAALLGIDCVPIFHHGKVSSIAELNDYMGNKSCLGDVPIEGLVIKNYSKFCPNKKALMAKFVSDQFKEDHKKAWKSENPNVNDIILNLGEIYRHENRWLKSIQHLKEKGMLDNSPKDIGILLKEIQTDILKECAEEIKEALFKWSWPKIQRKTIAGFSEWYKARLAQSQFEGAE